MANNRMFLLHRPSGLAVYLGKRMAWGWYGVPDDVAVKLCLLFEKTIDETGSPLDKDNFTLAMEDAGGLTMIDDNWGECTIEHDGLCRLTTKEPIS